MGLVSLLVEAGFPLAEEFVLWMGSLIDSASLYSFLQAYTFALPISLSCCTASFNIAFNVINKSLIINELLKLKPRYSNAWPTILSKVSASRYSNYSEVTKYFCYTDVDILTFVDNPLVFLDWIDTNYNSYTDINKAFREGQLYKFITLVVLMKTGLDIEANQNLRQLYKRWVSLSFVKYAFGSSLDQHTFTTLS